VKLAFRDLNKFFISLVTLWERHVTKRTCTQKKRKQEREKKRERETSKKPPRKNVFWSDVVFFTFYERFNRLDSLFSANKRRKMSLSAEFHLDRFRQHCAITHQSRSLEGDGILSLQRRQFLSTFLITRSLGVRKVLIAPPHSGIFDWFKQPKLFLLI